jgi:predicted nucleotidyltransferase
MPRQTAQAVRDFVLEVEATAAQLVGAYLYGSAARGAYIPTASDVDVLLVLNAHWPDEAIPHLVHLQARARAAGARADAVCATRQQVAALGLPVALDLVLPPDAPPQRDPGNRGMMFPIDRQDAWECGLALCGPPVREVVPPVPRELLHASLAWVFPYLAGNFRNPELMLCRAAHAFLEDRLCSKPEAGRWALGVLDVRWHALIWRALVERESGGTQAVCSLGELGAFQRACAELIGGSTGMSLKGS